VYDDNFALKRPTLAMLPSYIAALSTGYSPDNLRGRAAAEEQLARIAADAEAFIAQMHDPEGRGPPVRLPDGSLAQRLPGLRRWMWDGEFAGSIGLRWQPGTSALPPHVLGHIGYSVVPWKQRRGYATRALALLLDEARVQPGELVAASGVPVHLPGGQGVHRRLYHAGGVPPGYRPERGAGKVVALRHVRVEDDVRYPAVRPLRREQAAQFQPRPVGRVVRQADRDEGRVPRPLVRVQAAGRNRVRTAPVAEEDARGRRRDGLHRYRRSIGGTAGSTVAASPDRRLSSAIERS